MGLFIDYNITHCIRLEGGREGDKKTNIKTTMKPEEKNMKTEHATFKTFEEIISIVVNTDQISMDDTNEWINDLYGCYKDTKYHDVIEFAKFWFASLNKDTHDIWLDKRGLMLYELKGMLMQTGSFPIF